MPGIQTMALDLAIRNQGDKTMLSSTMTYSMKNVFFDVMNSLMMKKMNAQLVDGIMAGHKLYIETGTIVNDKTKLDLSKVKHVKMKHVLVILAGLFAMNTSIAQSTELGRSATEITMEVEIDAPIDKVWANFKDIGGIYKNSPTVDSSYVVSANKEGVGAKRYMIMAKSFKGAILEEENIFWNEADHYQKFNAYRIYKVQGIQTMGGDFRLTAKGNKTILTSTLNYSMKNRLFGMMNAMMGRKKFAKTWASILAGYKYHSETGIRVTADTDLPVIDVKLVEAKKNLNNKNEAK